MPSKKAVQQDTMDTADQPVNSDGFTTVTTRRRKRGQRQRSSGSVHNHQSGHQPSAKSIKLMDQVIDTVASQKQRHRRRHHSSDSYNTSSSEDGDSSVADSGTATVGLNAEIKRLREQIVVLQNKVEYILSFVGITDPTLLPDGSNLSSDTNNNSTNNVSGPSYASVAANGLPVRKLQGPVRNAVLTAVYSDLHAREAMKNNVVVCGLVQNPDVSDVSLFSALCRQHLGFTDGPAIVRSTRIGRSSAGRVQPLLITLSSNEDKMNLLRVARNLRHSTDDYVRKNIFISAQQTRAERQAAYEERCRRRQQSANKQSVDRSTHLHSTGAIMANLTSTSSVVVDVHNEPSLHRDSKLLAPESRHLNVRHFAPTTEPNTELLTDPLAATRKLSTGHVTTSIDSTSSQLNLSQPSSSQLNAPHDSAGSCP